MVTQIRFAILSERTTIFSSIYVRWLMQLNILSCWAR